jgi:hypothetical protein
MIVLSLMFFVLMVIVGGMAVDLMRHENARTKLQQTLDRSVLAAANMRQTQDADVVVRDYFTKASMIDQLKTVGGTEGINTKLVSAEGAKGVPTFFMDMLGIDSLSAAATAQAEENVGNIEISLVIDISGSMTEGPVGSEQITKLKDAAKNFFSIMLAGDSKESTSINVIPYAGHVNVGEDLFEWFGAVRSHSNSSCIELTAEDYTNSLAPGAGRGQVPHFMNWVIKPGWMNWGWCPMDESKIIVAQNDLVKLDKFITDIKLQDGTGTMTGIKYGLMLLDPSMNSAFNHLNSLGQVPAEFTDRPLPFEPHNDDANVKKYLIVMTDGMITDQHRPLNTTLIHPPGGPDNLDNEQVKTGTKWDAVQKKNVDVFIDDPDLVDGIDYPFWNATVALEKQPAVNRGPVLSSINTNVSRFQAQCDLARAKDVIVYTIAFNAPADARTQMKACANQATDSETFYYYINKESAVADGLDKAFESISRSIKQLRLTQ